MYKLTILISTFFYVPILWAQSYQLSGYAYSNENCVSNATVSIKKSALVTKTDSLGYFCFKNLTPGRYGITVQHLDYNTYQKSVTLEKSHLSLNIQLTKNIQILNDVVITGISTAPHIKNNPLAVTRVSQERIERTIENNIIDVLVKNVPGLNAVKTGPNISKPFIRGLGYNRILTLYNGIRQEGQQWGDEHGLEVDSYNIANAEVIKGPASLIYGSDALAGVVSLYSFVPKLKDGKLHGKITSDYQNNNQFIGNGLNFNYNNGRFLFSVNGSLRMAKNYQSPVDGRVYLTNFNEKNLSTLMGYQNTNGYTHLGLTLYHNKQGIPDGSRDSVSRKFTKQIYEGDKDIINQRPIVSEQELHSYKIPALSQYIENYSAYLHHVSAIKKGNIDVLLAWQQNIRREFNHPTMPQQAGMYVRLNTLSYNLHYRVPISRSIESNWGFNGMLQNNKNKDATDFPIPDYQLYDGGIFGYLKKEYQKWIINAGLRYDIRHIKWQDFYVGSNPNNDFETRIFEPNAEANLQFPAFDKTFRGLSGSLGITYQMNNHWNLKANIGRAYRAPNITEMASNGLDPGAHIIYLGNRNFTPEFSLQEDIGVIATYKDVEFEMSIFNNHIQNFIYQSMVVNTEGNPLIDAQGNKTYQYQQSAAQLYGGECSLSVHPENWKGFRIDNMLALVYGFNRNPLYKGKGTHGAYLPFIPPVKINSNISKPILFKHTLFQSLTPHIELEYNAAQKRFLGLNNTETFTPSYALLNTSIAAKLQINHVPIFLQTGVNNLLNTAYQSNLSRLKYFEYYSQTPNNQSGIYNMGRNIYLKISITF